MFFQKFKDLIKRSDLFYSSEMFRYDNELEYKSLTGGILSMALIITVLIGFANMIILTMKRETISSQKEVVKNSDPPFMAMEVSPQQKFMMGIQLYGVNLSAPISYFSYKFQEYTFEGGQEVNIVEIPLIQCTREHWAQLPQVVANFQTLGISNWLCPEIGFNLKLYGKYSSQSSSEYIFTLKQCVNSSTVICASPQEINQLFLDNSNHFALTYFYINSIVNQDKKDFMSYYLQDSQYVFFGDKIGSQAYIYFTDYTISTDYSIWPFQDTEQVNGGFIQNWMSRAYQMQYQGYYGGQYAIIRFNKSSNSITYKRQVQKISTVLSFIGGMISAVSAILFIIKAYNSQAFQIEIASALFTDPPESQQLKKNNFFSYLKFNAQKIIKLFKCCPSNSGFLVTEKCLQEMGKQLDVKSLVQRIIFLEHCLTFLFEDYQLESILMKRPTSYSAIKKVRQRCLEPQQVIEEDMCSLNNLVKLSAARCSSQLVKSSDVKMVQMRPQDNKKTNIRQRPKITFNLNHDFKEEISSQISQYDIKRKTLSRKKQTTLQVLQENAKKGDRISSKIFIHLHQKGTEAMQKTQQ